MPNPNIKPIPENLTRAGMGRPRKDYERIQVTLPPLLVAKMNAVAAERGVKRNDLFIEIFQKYLDKEHQEKLPLQPSRREGCNG
jgi:hypothetical protein